MRRYMIEEFLKIVREKFCATLQHRLDSMRKYHKRLTREVLEYMRDSYEDNISVLREGHGTDMRRLREGVEEEKLEAEKANMESEMTATAAYVNQE